MAQSTFTAPGVQLYHADCRDVLASLPPVDAVLADPPEWIGNAPKVASEHYLQTTDADFEKAAGKWEAPGEPLCAPNGSQNGSTPSAADSSVLLQTVQNALENGGFEQFAATLGKALQNYQVPPA